MSNLTGCKDALVHCLALLTKSIWLFPLLATVVLFGLTAFKISGSSVGVYKTLLYGQSKPDHSLLLNKPREIRSDEFVVNTQMTIAQKNNHFARINKNIGHGQDMSVVIDVPYAEWSQIFKPHNFSFFVMPLDYALAFKWWFMAYLLVLSCYFFVLSVLPGRRLLATCLAISLLFAGMIQWWYQYITFGPIYYSLFAATVIIQLIRAKKFLHELLWGALLFYILVCFALVLYPPFQIACALALGGFTAGYLLRKLLDIDRKEALKKLGFLVGSLTVSALFVFLFINTRPGVISTIEHTAYPGQRVISSGGFDPAHTFSGHLGFEFQFTSKASGYVINNHELLNQSEASNFILLLPFLLLPSILIIFTDYRQKKATDWPLISVNITFLLFMAWMFIPHLDALGKLLLLDKVQLIRLLLGLGLLNLFQLVLVIRRLPDLKSKLLGRPYILLYTLIILAVELWLGYHAMNRSLGFVSLRMMIALSLPVPIIIYALLRKHFTLAVIGFLAFSIFTTMGTNPLYHGTSILTQTPLSKAIQDINRQNKENGYWVTEISYLENFPAFNGAPSLSGVYAYPQLSLWKSADNGREQDIYNRYAHVNFVFDRDPAVQVKTELALIGGDHFDITTEACGPYMHQQKIRYILTTRPIADRCLQLLRTVPYPTANYLIYRVR